MRILTINKSRLLAEILSQLFELNGHATKIAIQYSAAVDLLSSFQPETIVIDLTFHPDKISTYLSKLREIAIPDVRLFVLTENIHINELYNMIHFKNIYIFHYDDSFVDLLYFLENPSNNSVNFSPKFNTLLAKKAKLLLRLTDCEVTILKLILDGNNSKLIAKKLCRSEDTVKNHRKNIKYKLEIKGGKYALLHLFNDSINNS